MNWSPYLDLRTVVSLYAFIYLIVSVPQFLCQPNSNLGKFQPPRWVNTRSACQTLSSPTRKSRTLWGRTWQHLWLEECCCFAINKRSSLSTLVILSSGGLDVILSSYFSCNVVIKRSLLVWNLFISLHISQMSPEELEAYVDSQFDELRKVVRLEEKRTLHLIDLKAAFLTAAAGEKIAEINVETERLQEEMDNITHQLFQLEKGELAAAPAPVHRLPVRRAFHPSSLSLLCILDC